MENAFCQKAADKRICQRMSGLLQRGRANEILPERVSGSWGLSAGRLDASYLSFLLPFLLLLPTMQVLTCSGALPLGCSFCRTFDLRDN